MINLGKADPCPKHSNRTRKCQCHWFECENCGQPFVRNSIRITNYCDSDCLVKGSDRKLKQIQNSMRTVKAARKKHWMEKPL